jgi:hypothetical protein
MSSTLVDGYKAAWTTFQLHVTQVVSSLSNMLALKSIALSAALAASLVASTPLNRDLQPRWDFPAEVDVLTATIKDLQEYLSNGTITSVQLTQHYLVRLRRLLIDIY